MKIRPNKAKMWGVVVAIQILNLSVAMLAYLIWHLKHKDEVRAAEQAVSEREVERQRERECVCVCVGRERVCV